MSNDTNKEELDLLKKRAELMGISFHPNIGLDTLKAKVNSTLEPKVEVTKVEVKATPKNIPKELTPAQLKIEARRKASKLIRVRITCMNPDKSAYSGEIFTVSNSIVGTFKKFVPFNAEDGWHIPQMILNVIKDKKFISHYTVKDKNGRPVHKTRHIKEFAVEILDPLTSEELKDLAVKQAMSKSTED